MEQIKSNTNLGHSGSKTTEIYMHVLAVNSKTVKSPLDFLENLNIFESNFKVSKNNSTRTNAIYTQ